MQHRYAFLLKAAVFLLSLTVFTACRRDDPAKPAAEQTEKLMFIVENLDNEKASEADRKKTIELYTSISSFEEMEKLIDLRYQHSLKTGNVDAERAAYLLDLRHKLNRTAFELKGKPFSQLDFASSEEVLAMVEPGKGKGGATTAGTTTDAGGRTAGDCNVTAASCTAWKPNGNILIYGSDYTNDREIDKGTFLGLRTFMCATNSYQNDCDYVYQYQYSKTFKAVGWKKSIALSWIYGSPSTKLIDNNPNRIDCGTYTLQIMYGKFRIDEQFNKPETALTFMLLVLQRDIECGWCYTGTGSTRKWYSSGTYIGGLDGFSGLTDAWGVEQPCACTVDNYVVY